MIFVDRKTVAAPSYLTDKTKAAYKEKQEAIKLFAISKDGKPGIKQKRDDFEFKAYNDGKGEVKKALKTLFKHKCAYCESKFTHVYYGDIEHFRPKKGVGTNSKKLRKPGYYWLGVDWDNLLFSCLFCNQSKKQDLLDGSVKSLGKQSQFPLDDEIKYKRRRKHTEPANFEDDCCLLIDPCKDNPELFLDYDVHGVIKSKASSGYEKRKAESSIHVFGLQRMPLVQRREAKIIEIYAQIKRIDDKLEELKTIIDSTDVKLQVRFNGILKRELRVLRNFCDPSEEFTGLARSIINKYLESIGLLKK